jgi:hypothetical protein
MQERMVEGKTEEGGGGERERGRSCGATFCFASFPKHLGRQRKVGGLLDEKWIRDNTCISRVQVRPWVLVLVYVQLGEEEPTWRRRKRRRRGGGLQPFALSHLWISLAVSMTIHDVGFYRRLGPHTPTA